MSTSAGVDKARDVFKKDVAMLFPILYGEVLDGDVAGPRGWFGSIDHEDCRLVILVERGGTKLGESKFAEVCTKIFHGLGCCNCGNEFSLRGNGGYSRLELGSIRYGVAAQRKDDAGDRASCRKVGGMYGIDVPNQSELVGG